MQHSIARLVSFSIVVLVLAVVPACDDGAPSRGQAPEPPHQLLAGNDELRLDPSDGAAPPQALTDAVSALDVALAKGPALEALEVVQPDDGETLVGDDQPPRFLWRDPTEAADTWWVDVRFEKQGDVKVQLLVLGGMPAEAALDPFSSTLHAWTPSKAVWASLVRHAAGTKAVVTFVGFAADAPGVPLSHGAITIAVTALR